MLIYIVEDDTDIRELESYAMKSSGYEVQYATASSFKGAKTVAVTSSKITSKKIAAVTSKRKYYVRVRAYKKDGNTKYYSAWSGVKTVVVK